MSLTASERETILRWSDDPEEPLTVFTHRETHAQRLLRAGGHLKRVSRIDGRVVGWTVEVPREWFRWPRKPPVMSEARRAAGAKALQNAREARKPPTTAGGNTGSGGA
jgi:hypothetical protein